jgi:hypothetical protein
MTLTALEAITILGWTPADDTKSHQVVVLLPLITDQINEYCNGGFSHQVKEQLVSFSGAGSSNSALLGHTNIIRNSLYVTSTGRNFIYYGDCMGTGYPNPHYAIPSTEIEEYKVDYDTGNIWAASSSEGRLIPSTNGLVTYAYVDLVGGGKLAATRMISAAIKNPAGIASESAGALSRSYVSEGMDAMTQRLLTPYRRPSFG